MIYAALLCALVSLDKQGAAHGSSSQPVDDKAFNLSGSLILGAALYNPSYAARPDNTGLALMRYAGHLDVDVIGAYLSFPIDVNFFTDRTRPGALVLAPTEFDIIAGVTTTWKLGPGSLEGGVRVEHDRPVDTGTFTQSYVDTRARYVVSLNDTFPKLRDFLLDGDLSGWATLGWFAFNPSYAARPDNSGLALFRYALHAELSLWHDYISFGVDATMFTDRQRWALLPSELDLTVMAMGHYGPFELIFAYERDMPTDGGGAGYVQHFIYTVLAVSFDLHNVLHTRAFTDKNHLVSP